MDDNSHVLTWRELHSALERVGEKPDLGGQGQGAEEGGEGLEDEDEKGRAAAWAVTLLGWVEELRKKLTIQVGVSCVRTRTTLGVGWGQKRP